MLYNPKSLGPKLSPSGGYRTLGEVSKPTRSFSLVENLPRDRRPRRRRSNPDNTMYWVAGGTAVLLAGFGIGMLIAAAEKRSALQSGQRTAVKSTEFHLRPTATDPSVGTLLPSGTRLSLLEQGSLTRGTATMWKVRTPQGAEGWTYVLPSEMQA